ncbi:MAG TPA: ATP-binding protein [Methylomirabilota bacterium]|jgi:two-component system sensor histidine kinase AtoS|nr:ATP-binding protein [Methylomirabilota bacterium]
MIRGTVWPLRSLQARFLWATVLVIFVLMTAVIIMVEHRQRASIIGEVERRGEVLTRNLAATSYAPLLLYNFTALEQNVARVASEEDVRYAIVLDADARVAAHSRRHDRVGAVLDDVVSRRAAAADTSLTQQTNLPRSGEGIYDFAVPIIVEGHRWGTVRVGLSKRRMEAEIRYTRLELLGFTAATLVLGGLAAALVARRIARPVRQLAEGVTAISRGELLQRIEPSGFDEIGALAVAFNHMASQLFQQRRALEDAHTELRQRFVELEDVKRYTENILASLTNGIVTVDLDGRVVTLNPAAEILTGFFAGEVTSRYCTELFAQTPEIGEMLMETLASRTPIAGVALALKRRSGVALPVEVSTAPLKGGEGKDLGVVAVLRDVTLVRELEGRLRRSDRLAALGSLAAGLAHEVKNPLTSVLTFSRHVARRFDDPHFRERFQRVVPRELERINGIIERLLELSRPVPASFTRIGLASLVDRAVELFANEIESQQVQVVRDYARDLPPVPADEESLYRAIINVISNALDVMQAGGRLGLRLGWAGSHEGFRPPRATLASRQVVIEISDTGAGIRPEEADRLFNPFFTTKERGTGLGLAVTHKIIEDHGGVIDFQSVAGVGTTFRIVLPLVASPAG